MRVLQKTELTAVAGAASTITHTGLTGTFTYTPTPEAAAYIAAVKQAFIAHAALLKSVAIKYHTAVLAHLQGTTHA